MCRDQEDWYETSSGTEDNSEKVDPQTTHPCQEQHQVHVEETIVVRCEILNG